MVGMDWEFEVSRCKLLNRMGKQQGPTVYHRNYSQHPIINPNRKKYKKNLCIYLIHI